MAKCERTKSRRHFYFLSLAFCLAFIVFQPSPSFAEKIYIDITSPTFKKLPIAVQSFTGNKEISDIVKNDLTFTGLFDCLDDAAQIEHPDQPFNAASWQGLGVALVVKGRVSVFAPNKFLLIVSAYDVTDGRQVMDKNYAATADQLRYLAHSAANDIYTVLTGQQGIFKTRIAFVADKAGHKEMYMMDWDGQRVEDLGIGGDLLLAPRWASDRSRLLYSAERWRQWGIYLLNMNTMKERNLGLMNGLNVVGNFFPNNYEFVFSSTKDGKPGIYVADLANVKGHKIISSPWIDVSPSVSPDGKSIVFVSNRSGNPQVYISDRDGYGVHRLTYQGNYNTAPVWSPQGDKIAYTSMIGGRNQLFIIKVDGTGVTQLTDRGNNENPFFSPDGRYLTFTSNVEGPKGIYIIRVTGDGLVRMSPKGMRAYYSSWSPL